MFIRQRGFTLIELMVTLAISGVILAGVVNLYTGSLSQSKLTSNLTAIQESGRFALEMMARDIRMAGYSGCFAFDELEEDNNKGAGAGMVDSQSSFWGLYTRGGVAFSEQAMRGIQGWEANSTALGTAVSLTSTRSGTGGSGWTTSPSGSNVLTETYSEAVTGSDIIRLWTVGDLVADISAVSSTANSVTLTAPTGHGFAAGDLVMFAGCSKQRLVGQICSVSGQQLVLSQGNSGTCNNTFRSNLKFDATAAANAEATSFRDVTYFIGKRDTAANTPPSLYRAVGTTAREVVEGVENMQIMYGVDLDHRQDKLRTADKYVTAADVGTRWSDVVSVRISIIVRSFENNLVSGTRTFDFNNTPISVSDNPDGSGDRYVRQVYSTTVALRNRTVGEVAGLGL